MKLNMEERAFVGFDIGGTKCAVIMGCSNLENSTCSIQTRVQIPTKEKTWKNILDFLLDAEKRMEKETGLHPLAAGISSGGPLDSKGGLILSPPNLPGWDSVPIVSLVQNELHVPTFLQNDANAGAVAEWLYGAGKGYKNVIFLTFGTGLGAGFILDGKLYEGTNMMAGEVGHVRLGKTGPEGYHKKGSFEGFCSGGGIVALGRIMSLKYKAMGKHSPLLAMANFTAKDIAGYAREGDGLSLQIYKKSAQELGYGLAMLVDILNPQCIILGSIYARNPDLFQKDMEQILHHEALSRSLACCTIVPAQLGDSIGDFAALAVATSGFHEMEKGK